MCRDVSIQAHSYKFMISNQHLACDLCNDFFTPFHLIVRMKKKTKRVKIDLFIFFQSKRHEY